MIASRDVMSVAREEFNLLDDLGHPFRQSRRPRHVGIPQVVLDDVGVYGLVRDPVPAGGEVGQVPRSGVHEPHAFGVDHVEGTPPAGRRVLG